MGEHCEIGEGREIYKANTRESQERGIQLSASESPERAGPDNLASGFSGLENGSVVKSSGYPFRELGFDAH